MIHLATTNGRRDVEMMRNLVTAWAQDTADTAGHLIYLSIVGCDRVPLPYYRYKAEAERLALEARRPTTVLRSTQFHPLVARVGGHEKLPGDGHEAARWRT